MGSVSRRLILICFVSCMIVGIVLGQGHTITILHVNDTHGHLESWGPKTHHLQGDSGGIARAATIINAVRAREPNVLLLHAGDIFQGDPIFNTYLAVPELQLMKKLNFDAMTIGNHEFDFGPDALTSVITTAFANGGFPLLSANLDMSAYPPLQPLIQPSIIKTIEGVKIGIFGMTVPDNPTYQPAPVIVEENIVDIAAAQVADLRGKGANVVICLSHLGFYNDNTVAQNVSGIDYIIGAHDHYLFPKPIPVVSPNGATTYIFQAGGHYAHIGKLTIEVKKGIVSMKHYEMITIARHVRRDREVQAIVNTIKKGVVAKFGKIYSTISGYAPCDLAKTYSTSSPYRDTPMGDLVTDALRQKTGTTISITAIGLISEQLYHGPVIQADIFRAMSYGYDQATGYGFQVATIGLQGTELIKGMEIGLSQLGVTDDYFLQFSGMKFSYDPKQPVGQRVDIPTILINGQPIDPNATYSVTLNTGLLGLVGMFGVNVQNVQVLPPFEYEVVRDFIAKKKVINYKSEGRIIEEGVAAAHKTVQVDMQKGEKSSFRIGNSPNPFNPSTMISFTLPNEGYVSLSVYNSIGQEVGSLIHDRMTAGDHQVVWNAAAMPSGVYFYTLRLQPTAAAVPAVNKTGKMLLVK